MVRTNSIIRRGVLLIAAVLFLLFSQVLPVVAAENDQPAVKLAVLLIVDQMRVDYLSRWSHLYTDGLHRLIENGVNFTNVHHDHAATLTAVGHATIATGTVPAKHGITGNSFYDRGRGCKVNSVTDSTTEILGGVGGIGASPRQLLRSTIGDWLKKVSPTSKVFSASLKDRAAILMGGKTPDGVFWYDKKSGDFVTSGYYAKGLPNWVATFNDSGIKDNWKDSLWAKNPGITYPGKDTVFAERSETSSAFPHTLFDGTNLCDYYSELYCTPYGDALLLQFGLDLLRSENLGEDTIPDLLMISLSAADPVGHDYGSDSHEIIDYYIRLDSKLGIFLDSLDARVGEDNYIFVLASDHGVCPLPEVAVTMGKSDYRRLPSKDYKQDVARILTEAFPDCSRAEALLVSIGHGYIIDSAVAADCALSREMVEHTAAKAIEQLDYVADVFTFTQLSANSPDNRPYARLFKNSFRADRSPDLFVNFNEGVLVISSPTGTTHGSPYYYDTDVPLVFYGAGIKPLIDTNSVRTVDITPTIISLLRIAPEAGVDGKILPLFE